MPIMTYDELRRIAREGISVNGSMGLGGHGEGFEQQNQGVTRRQPGEGPKVNGGRSQSQEMDSMDQPQYVEEEFMGVRDSDVLDKQNPFVGSQESGGPIGEESKLDKESHKEKEEHPWASMKVAKRIAKDHMKENKITLKEFFNVDEASPMSNRIARQTPGGSANMDQPNLDDPRSSEPKSEYEEWQELSGLADFELSPQGIAKRDMLAKKFGMQPKNNEEGFEDPSDKYDRAERMFGGER